LNLGQLTDANLLEIEHKTVSSLVVLRSTLDIFSQTPQSFPQLLDPSDDDKNVKYLPVTSDQNTRRHYPGLVLFHRISFASRHPTKFQKYVATTETWQ